MANKGTEMTEMSFETTVIKTTLAMLPHSEARFFNGTLYVECAVPEAVKLETALHKQTSFGIIMSLSLIHI